MQQSWDKPRQLAPAFRLVLDTNVLFSGLTRESSPAQIIVDALQQRRAIPILSPAVLAEYRATLLHPEIMRRVPTLTEGVVDLALKQLRYFGDVYREIRVKFSFPRDPRDAMFIELAIVGNASHVVTFDADLLSLPASRDDAGKRFRQRLPKLKILRPADFLREVTQTLD